MMPSNKLMRSIMEKLLLSIDDAANALSIGKTKLYAELKSGNLQASKLGKRTLIPRESIQDYIDKLDAYSKTTQ